MSNTVARLAVLNSLRVANGKKPLATWKASTADLEQRILDEQPAPVVTAPVASSPVSPDLAKALASTKVKPTVIPASAPELTQPARKRAIIKQIADASVKADKPTTVIDAKAAARSLRKQAKKVTTKQPKAAPATTKSPSDFATYLESIGMDAKIARAKLRRAGFSAPYAVTAELKAALKADARKK